MAEKLNAAGGVVIQGKKILFIRPSFPVRMEMFCHSQWEHPQPTKLQGMKPMYEPRFIRLLEEKRGLSRCLWNVNF